MNKNVIIGVLAVLCCGLLAMLVLGGGNKEPRSVDAIITKSVAAGKLPHPQVIAMASLYGLSLDTPVDEIDALITKTPFECRSNEREIKTPDGKTSQEKLWRCSHKTFKGAELSISVIDNKIQSIRRDGPSSKQEVEEAITQLDLLKMRMDGLDGFSLSQNERSTVFRLSHKKEDGGVMTMSYRAQILPVRDPENKPEHDGMLNVVLVR